MRARLAYRRRALLTFTKFQKRRLPKGGQDRSVCENRLSLVGGFVRPLNAHLFLLLVLLVGEA